MPRRFGRSALFVTLAAALAPLGCQQEGPPVAMPTARPANPEQTIGKVLDAWHAAAARADENAYFAAFAKNGVFMGTDATERWDVAAFRAYAHPYFAKGKAWAFRPVKRTVTMAPGGESAWFDEELDTPNLGPARGTGVVVRDGATFKIAQYNLSVPIPNDRFKDVKRLIAGGAPAAPRLAAHSDPPPAFTDPDRDKKLLATLPKLEALVKSEYESRKVASLAVALVVDGRTVMTAVHGHADLATKKPATADTVYRIGSITKTFTTAALLAQRDKGRLAVDDRLDRWLPEAGVLEHEPRDSRPITLRDVMTHSSGLPRLGDFDYTRPDKDVTEAEVLGALGKARVHAPGTTYLYSNYGMGLLGIVVGRAGGKPYRDVVKETLLAPLGMSSSGFDPASLPPGALATGYKTRGTDKPEPSWRLGASEAAGGMYASLSDMAKWVAFQADAWPPRDDAEAGPLARASRREAHALRFWDEMTAESKKDGPPKVDAIGVGYAWHVRQTCAYEKLVEHGGAIDGFNGQVSFAPDRGFGVVVLVNALDGGAYPIADKILDAIAAEGALLPREQVPSRELSDLVARVADKMGSFDAPTYEALFDASFRRAIPLEKIQEVNAVMAKAHGACVVGRAESVTSANNATFHLKCTHGTVKAHAVSQGGKLTGLVVESAGLPAPKAVSAAADEMAALAAKWDDARAKKAFAASIKLDEIKAGFAKQAEKGGTCKLAGPGDGDGVRRATFPITCSKLPGQTWELILGLDKDGKTNEIFFRPKKSGARRCH